MGNICVNSKVSHDNGILYTISCTLGWSKSSPDHRISYNNREVNEKSACIEMVPEGSGAVQNYPPEVVKIIEEEKKKSSEEKKSAETIRPQQHHVIMIVKDEKSKAIQATKWEDVIKIAAKDKKPWPKPVVKPSVIKAAKVEQGTPKKAHNVKRMASAGLQAASILKTKTGHLKEYFNLGHKLGHGQYGTTFQCVEKTTRKEYACKSIAKRKLTHEEDIEDVRREIEIMHHLSGHPSVISIKGAYEDAVAVHIVMELCTGGELFDRIVKVGYYTERKAAELTRTIVGVVEACHSLGVMHRDLKPENFLFVNEDEDSPLKIIDFGLSVFFKPGEILTDMVGSPYYVAPEVLSKQYGPEADIWSAGVILYIILSGTPPFWGESEEEIFHEIQHGDIDFTSDPWPNISDGARDLVKKMLVRDPKKRITAYQVLCHSWVQIDGVAPDRPLDSAVFSRLKQFSAMNKLKKMALRIIAECLTEEEIGGLREMFKMIDTDNSGQITFEELKAGLKRFGANINESEIYDLLQAADVDNSGTIDYGEFIAATLHLSKIEKEELLHAAFSYFDKDGSGYITQDELQKACEEFGVESSCLEEMIQEADQDNDGRIDYSEFVAMMHQGNLDLGKKRLPTCLSSKLTEATPVC